MHGLADAARSRSEADWLVGINGTRAMTAFNSRDGGFFLTTVGRVQTPTLVDRGRARGEDPQARAARLLGGEGVLRRRRRARTRASGSTRSGSSDENDVERRADRLWNERDANSVADAVRGKTGTVSEEAKPSTQSSPLLYDLTSLQREANGRFGFSAKTTLSLAQALYEKHKVLTYPRTDSRALPEDYLAVAKKTAAMLARGGDLPAPLRPLAQHAKKAIDDGYIKPIKRVFDNAKVSDHFAIIPTLQAPKSLTEAELKLYDMVVKRFLAVFYPPAEYLVTTRITKIEGHSFQTNGKVLVNPGWLAVYGKEAQDDDANLVPVQPDEKVRNDEVNVVALKTRPPPRYTEATLLSAMEGAGKLIDDDELREAMQEKGLGTPATRAAIIEGLILEKYMHREGRELVPSAKAFQLMTLLRGLDVEDLTKPELTGAWEYQLAEMEHGRLKREAFMREIAKMAERIVKKAKEYDRDTIPGDYATLKTPCPNCGGVGEGELPALRLREVRLQHHQDSGRAQLRARRGRSLPARQEDRPARRLSLQGRLAVHGRAAARVRRRAAQLEARVRLRRRGAAGRGVGRAGRLRRSAEPRPLPEVQGAVSMSSAPPTSASTRSAPTSPATSRAARSSCSSRSRASR